MECLYFEVTMDSPSKRIQILMAEADINQRELAKKVDRSPPLISGYLNSENEIPEAFLLRLEKRLKWSSMWIQTGEGPKYTNSNSSTKKHPHVTDEAEPLYLVDKTEVTTTPSGSEFRDLENGMVLLTIPLVDEYAYAGYLSGWKDPEFIDDLPKHSIVLSKRDTGRYRSFKVRGDSMDDDSKNAICEGDIATGRNIEPDFWLSRVFIVPGRDYIIVHEDGVIVKRIVKHDTVEATILCTSTNPDKEAYPDMILKLPEVYEIYSLVKVERDWQRR